MRLEQQHQAEVVCKDIEIDILILWSVLKIHCYPSQFRSNGHRLRLQSLRYICSAHGSVLLEGAICRYHNLEPCHCVCTQQSNSASSKEGHVRSLGEPIHQPSSGSSLPSAAVSRPRSFSLQKLLDTRVSPSLPVTAPNPSFDSIITV